MYRVKDIIEPDFGCEGVPEGEEICCEVILEDIETGITRMVKIPDAELYRKCITTGSLTEYTDNVLEKVG